MKSYNGRWCTPQELSELEFNSFQIQTRSINMGLQNLHNRSPENISYRICSYQMCAVSTKLSTLWVFEMITNHRKKRMQQIGARPSLPPSWLRFPDHLRTATVLNCAITSAGVRVQAVRAMSGAVEIVEGKAMSTDSAIQGNVAITQKSDLHSESPQHHESTMTHGLGNPQWEGWSAAWLVHESINYLKFGKDLNLKMRILWVYACVQCA